MNALVINRGSSSLKFSIFNVENENLILNGSIANHGNEAKIKVKNSMTGEIIIDKKLLSFETGLSLFYDIAKTINIDVVIHRVVHGGEKYSKPVLVNEEVINNIKKYSVFSPIHNIFALEMLENIKKNYDVPNIAVFDTSFHMTIPMENYLYQLPKKYYEQYKIRKYGFHGISYQYIVERLCEIDNQKQEDINAIICHLGGGSSLCSIKNGLSYNTTMGFMPTGGLMMPSRMGDIDPSVIAYMIDVEKLSFDETMDILNKQSGYVGVCDIGDEKEVCDQYELNNEDAIMARKLADNNFKRTLGSYLFENPKANKVILTGGMGSNNYRQRALFLSNLNKFGIDIDLSKNELLINKEGCISTINSEIPIYVIPTNEEKMMVRLYKKTF